MKKLVIFDLDGTLVNSIEDLGEATNHALSTMGYPTHPMIVYPSLVGSGVSKLLERALPEEARRQRVIEAMKREFKAYYDEHLTDHTKVYPGIHELLDEMAGRSISMAVASNKYQEAVSVIVSRLFPRIEWAAVMGHRDGIPVKPDPSIVFNVLLEHPTPKAETLYVGDSGIDIETARRACVESVGVTWGFRGRSELVAAHADHIVSDPDEILSLLS
ncbi:MAG: HAD family hydrolase [Bacteroidales bacterium]|nr:HAD family hydrolase [Bacteroidales bacterium]